MITLSRSLAALLCALVAFPSPTVAAETWRQFEVKASIESGPLRGTLALPAKPQTAMVIIPGSGPTDRDGNNPFGISAGYLRMLAENLASRGIASVRIDKRGMFGSAGSFPDPNDVTFEHYAGDVRTWAALVRERAGARCAWLAGHSEGGVVALVAAQQAGPDICGLVLIAAPGRRMGAVLLEQLAANPVTQPVIEEARKAVEALSSGERLDAASLPTVLQGLFDARIQGFLIDAFRRDPATLIARVGDPVLILQGDNDLQVGQIDAETLSAAQPNAQITIVHGMNHVLKIVAASDRDANLASYSDPTLPVAPDLIDIIAEFVTQAR